MKAVKVNATATIISGVCKGMKGKVTAFNEKKDLVEIKADNATLIIVTSENIEQ